MKYHFVLDASWRLIATDLGVQPVDALRGTGLPDDAWTRDEIRLPSEQFFGFWRNLETQVNNPSFPVRLGQVAANNSLSPLVFAFLCSPSFEVAVGRFHTYKRLSGPLNVEPVTLQDRLRVRVHWLDSSSVPPLSLPVVELVFLVQMLRHAVRTEIRPMRVVLPATLVAAPYEEFFGVRVEQGDDYLLEVSLSDAKRPFLSSSASMWAAFEPQLRRRLGELNANASAEERVRAALLEALPSGRGSRREVAKMLGTSERSLSRSLRHENTSFRELISKVRRDLAIHYLESSGKSSAEIGFLLGFDHVNSFYRAFRGWTGTTPETVRGATAE